MHSLPWKLFYVLLYLFQNIFGVQIPLINHKRGDDVIFSMTSIRHHNRFNRDLTSNSFFANSSGKLSNIPRDLESFHHVNWSYTDHFWNIVESSYDTENFLQNIHSWHLTLHYECQVWGIKVRSVSNLKYILRVVYMVHAFVVMVRLWSVLPISFKFTSLALGWSCDCSSVIEATLKNMDIETIYICNIKL